jgi:hypothetical protein
MVDSLSSVWTVAMDGALDSCLSPSSLSFSSWRQNIKILRTIIKNLSLVKI